MVSEISLDSWLTFGGGVERERAEACVAKAFELGIDFIDTANQYQGPSAIIGASRPEQIEDNAGASGVELDPATLARVDEILGDSDAFEVPDSAR